MNYSPHENPGFGPPTRHDKKGVEREYKPLSEEPLWKQAVHYVYVAVLIAAVVWFFLLGPGRGVWHPECADTHLGCNWQQDRLDDQGLHERPDVPW